MKYQIHGLDATSNMPREPLDIEAATEEAARQQAEELGMTVQRVEPVPRPPRSRTGHTVKRSKVRELGLFWVGIGIVFTTPTLFLFVSVALGPVRQPEPASVLLVVAYSAIPPAVMALAGALLLAIRSEPFIVITVVVLTLVFLADTALFPPKVIISGPCVYLIWKAGGQALDEVQGNRRTRQHRIPE